jgi:hypothetical protein
MGRPLRIAIFLLLILAQLYVPASMIRGHEAALEEGLLVKFRCAPVDPYDPFRGRYVALALDIDEIAHPQGKQLPFRMVPVYVQVTTDDEGFAVIQDVTLERPDTPHYFRARGRGSSGARVDLTIPFNRFYMNEAKAPAAERAYRDSTRGESSDTYIVVGILDGYSAIEDLYLDGRPVNETLEEGKN